MKTYETLDEGWCTLLEREDEHWEVWDNRTDKMLFEARGDFACLRCFKWAKLAEVERRNAAQAKAR
jgi:hypothetical protein